MSSESKAIMLQASNITDKVDGYWLSIYAADFLAAAQSFQSPEQRFSPVRYYLICHSIELALKAFLFTAGYKKNDRKNLNHNLLKILAEAEGNGLGNYFEISHAEKESIEKANELYQEKKFEYFESLETIYDPHNFELDVLEAFAQRLVESIEAPIQTTIFE